MNRRTFTAAALTAAALPRRALARPSGPLTRYGAVQVGSEIWTSEPEHAGVRANAPIPVWQHVLNEGGSDGAGLCVIASHQAAGLYQDVPELRAGKDSEIWRRAKAAPGGYYATKFDSLMRESGFETAWWQYEGPSSECLDMLEHYNAQGLPLSVTMAYGERYGRNIHHMVSLLHLDKDWACIVDNNFPGEYCWITRDEFARRFQDGPSGWFIVILYGGGPKGLNAKQSGGIVLLSAALLAWMRRRQ